MPHSAIPNIITPAIITPAIKCVVPRNFVNPKLPESIVREGNLWTCRVNKETLINEDFCSLARRDFLSAGIY